jgi:hypothetical protein
LRAALPSLNLWLGTGLRPTRRIATNLGWYLELLAIIQHCCFASTKPEILG